MAAFRRCDFTTARNYFELELNEAKQAGNKHGERKAYTNLGAAYGCLGDYQKEIEFHQQSLSIAKEIGEKGSEGTAYTNLGVAYGCLGDYQKAIEFHHQSLNIAKEIGDKSTERKSYNNLGLGLQNLHDFPKAEECYESSIKVFEDMRFLLQEKDEWKISFRDQVKTYSSLWISQLRQGKTKEALFTAERERAQALTDLMESQFGAKSSFIAYDISCGSK